MSCAELADTLPEQQHLGQFLNWLEVNSARHAVMRRVAETKMLTVFVAAPRQGRHGLWIAFKSGSSPLSDYETESKAYLEMAGYEVHVVREWTQAARITVAYLNIEIAELVQGLPYSSDVVDEYRRRRTR